MIQVLILGGQKVPVKADSIQEAEKIILDKYFSGNTLEYCKEILIKMKSGKELPVKTDDRYMSISRG
jgi:hypothetical protein